MGLHQHNFLSWCYSLTRSTTALQVSAYRCHRFPQLHLIPLLLISVSRLSYIYRRAAAPAARRPAAPQAATWEAPAAAEVVVAVPAAALEVKVLMVMTLEVKFVDTVDTEVTVSSEWESEVVLRMMFVDVATGV